MIEKKPVTIEDIAREAGVSPSTVSRVLNQSKPVNPQTAAAVRDAIERLRFRPNTAAQGLARGKSRVIGVLTEDLASPFYGEIIRGVEQGFAHSQYYPLFVSSNWHPGAVIDGGPLDMLLNRRVDGLILVGSFFPESLLRDVIQQMPCIAVCQTVPGLERRSLLVESHQAAIQLTRHLIELGHRRIVHITGPLSNSNARERLDGYSSALAQAGIAVDPALILTGNFLEESGLVAMGRFLAGGGRCTAVFAANDQMALGARMALFNHGLEVPRDVSLVGFDDQPVSRYTIPPLTTVSQPTADLGRNAASAMLSLLDGQQVDLPEFSARLVLRQSTAPAPESA